MLVVGIDGCDGGWVAVVLKDGRFEKTALVNKFEHVPDKFSDADVVAVDIPIGLSEDCFRPVDEVARDFVGSMRSSVFPTPPRPVLEAATYEQAKKLSKDLTAKGVSKQSYSLRAKIFEVE